MGHARRFWTRWAKRVAVLATVGLLLQCGLVVWRVRHNRLGLIVGGFATVTMKGGTRQVLVKHSWAATDCYSETFKRDSLGGIGTFNAAGMMSRAAGPGKLPPWYRTWSGPEIAAYLETAERSAAPGGTSWVTLARAGIGWPCRAFQGARVYNGIVDTRAAVSYFSPNPAVASPGYVRVGQHDYPAAPIWRGLALDVAIVLGAGVLPFAARDTWRWHTRTREGQCPRCRYNLAGLRQGEPCPECGSPVSALTAQPASTPASSSS